MRIRRLSYHDFRNYQRLELALPPGRVVLLGENAQGKTNFLEGIYLLATARSPRAEAERELISWGAAPPLARLAMEATRATGPLKVDLVLHAGETGPTFKRVRVNGLPRRAQDLPGELLAVWFSPEDIDLIGGPPALRRRYLDLLLAPTLPDYRRALTHYGRVLVQRNHLLRLLGEGKGHALGRATRVPGSPKDLSKGDPAQLEFWDRELVAAGALITAQRRQALASLTPLAGEASAELSGGGLELQYLPSLSSGTTPEEIAPAFLRLLEGARAREIGVGMTLFGPHRDDLRFLKGGHDLGVYGSRGEQRVAALALRLAEARFLQAAAGEPPLLLLDDALSELDQERRRQLQKSCFSPEQVFLTTTDTSHLDPSFLDGAALLKVHGGEVNGA